MQNLAKELIEIGYNLVDIGDDRRPKRPFINRETGKFGYPLNEIRANEWLGVIFDDLVLIDVDANKADCEVSASYLENEICAYLSIDEFDLGLSLVQCNEEETSKHFLFKLPNGMSYGELSRTNNTSKLIKHVDFKTGKGAQFLKPHKKHSFMPRDSIFELSLDNVKKIFGLKKDQPRPPRATFQTTKKTTKYGQAAIHAITEEALNFTESGQLNDSLAKAVVSLSELSAGGEISIPDLDNAIEGIKESLAILDPTGTMRDDTATTATIEHNRKKGIKQPRRAPKPDEPEPEPEPTTTTAKPCKRVKYIKEKIENTFYSALDYEIELDENAIADMYTRTYWSDAQSKFLIASERQIVSLAKLDVLKSSVELYKPIYSVSALDKHMSKWTDNNATPLSRTEQRKWQTYTLETILAHIVLRSQRPSLIRKFCPFTDKAALELTQDTATFTLPHYPLTPVNDGKINGKYVKLYEEFFPECYEIIDFIVNSRFAANRKNAYLWIKAPSNWGKTLIARSLQHLALETSVTEISTSVKGQNISKTANEFATAFALIVDEFRGITGAIKQLEDQIFISAKYALSVRVPLYAKIFLSAEDVPSLEGEYGVEAQFCNRFCKIEGKGSLHDLGLKGGEFYEFVNTVKNLWATRINAKVAELVKLGRLEAEKTAQIGLDGFTKKYTITKDTLSMSESLQTISDDILDYLLDAYDRNDKKIAMWAAAPKGHVILKRPVSAVKNVIAAYYNKADAAMLGYKARDIANKMGDTKNHYTKYSCVRGIRIDVRERKVVKPIPPHLQLLDNEENEENKNN